MEWIQQAGTRVYCEHGNELTGFINRAFLEQLNNCQLFMEDCNVHVI